MMAEPGIEVEASNKETNLNVVTWEIKTASACQMFPFEMFYDNIYTLVSCS